MDSAVNISVVIPVWNSAEYIAKTLETVAAQTVAPMELVISDDGSTDETCAVVEAFFSKCSGLTTKLLRNPHRGPGAARNAGIRAAAGDWIGFLDSDDLWHPAKLEKMTTAIRAHPSANLFCHNEIIRLTSGAEWFTDYGAAFSHHSAVHLQLYNRNLFSTSAVILRRDLLLRWTGFDESLASAQDYELWLRMSPDLEPVFVPEVLGTYVMRRGNISTSRFWRRWLNILRVKHRHRTKVGAMVYFCTMFRTTVSQLASPLLSRLRRELKHWRQER